MGIRRVIRQQLFDPAYNEWVLFVELLLSHGDFNFPLKA